MRLSKESNVLKKYLFLFLFHAVFAEKLSFFGIGGESRDVSLLGEAWREQSATRACSLI